LNELLTNRWQLPDGVNELLPADAWRVESLRRRIMDNSYRWGYELIMPPMIEYIDSLLTGTGETLDLQTFKIIDQHNGRTLGIRADMTPQVARMDAHALRSDLLNRFFYTGSVLLARTNGAGGSRTPLQFGAELFGHGGPDSDAEIIHLMIDTVVQAGVKEEHLLLDMGHVGVYRALIQSARLSSSLEAQLFDALLRGSKPEVTQLMSSADVSPHFRQAIADLTQLSGNLDTVLERARSLYSECGEQVAASLDNLQAISNAVLLIYPQLNIHIDFAELRGYRYHTGILFALYDLNGTELTRGGRYDAIGEAFGCARPATGFSGDLIKLAFSERSVSADDLQPANRGIWVDQPLSTDLWLQIMQLRANGERVVMAISGAEDQAVHCQCDRVLTQQDGHWVVKMLPALTT